MRHHRYTHEDHRITHLILMETQWAGVGGKHGKRISEAHAPFEVHASSTEILLAHTNHIL